MASHTASKTLVAAAVAAGIAALVAVRMRPRPSPATGTAQWQPLAPVKPGDAGDPTRSDELTRAGTKETQAGIDSSDGSCPTTHPVKGNLDSGIFHVPGGLSYERTKAERCYVDADAALADGLRQAKR